MRKILLLLLIPALLLSMFACSPYTSSYSATMLVRSSKRDHCEVHFGTLKGTLVLNTKVTDEDADGLIHYEAELAEGELSVWYDVDGTKEHLFTIKGGESLDDRGGSVSIGDKVIIIIETSGKAKDGEIEIDFD